MAGFFQNLWNGLAPNYQTDEEREANELQGLSNDLWGQVMQDQPGANDLAGYGLFAGQMPQEYIEQYFRENSNLAPELVDDFIAQGGLSNLSERQMEEIRNAYTQQQLAEDPLWGLNVADESSLAGARADRGSIQAQRNALRNMEGIYNAGGYTDAERAQIQMAQRDAAMGERSQRLAVMENARARGMGGGGMELMGALEAQQGGANRASDWANQIEVAGQQRALQALQQSGNWAGQMRGQSFSEDATRRAAADAWNQYQTGLIADRQSQYGNAAQQAYANQMNATAGATGQYMGASNNLQQQSQQNTQQAMGTAGNIAGAVMTGIGYAAGGPAGGAAAGAVGGMLGRSGQPTGDPYELPEYQQQRNGGRTY